MTALGLVWWVAIVLVADLVIRFVTELYFRKKERLRPLIIWEIVQALISIEIAILAMGTNLPFGWQFFTVSAVIHIVTGSDCISSLITVVICKIRGGKTSPVKMEDVLKSRRKLGFFITLLILAYGTINSQVIVPHEVSFTSEKLHSDHRFVMISDLHYGNAQTEGAVDRMLEEIVAADPEFILLNGDITDEWTEKTEMEGIYQKFGELSIPTYFVYGNHDRQSLAHLAKGQTYTPDELAACLEANGIRVLCDEVVEIGDDISLLGREDLICENRLPVDALPVRSSDRYQITAEHQPYNTDDIIATKADLQLSGHSHAGQFFPLQCFYNIAGFDSYGCYHVGDTLLYVNSGTSGWKVPFRTEKHSRFEIITLKSISE